MAHRTPEPLSRLLHASILLFFDRTGYRRHAAAFDPTDLQVDLEGRMYLVTGANSGIGFETSLALAARGARVWMLCRNRKRGMTAVSAVRRRTRSRRVQLDVVDVADAASIRRFFRSLKAPVVDVIVHNAGVLPDARTESAAGQELTFATHVLGPWLLTRRLLPRLRKSRDARVMFVASGGMYTQRLSVSDWQWRDRPYDGVIAYAQTKRMQVVLAELLAAELHDSGICVNAMHPGWADTPAVRASLPRFWTVMRRLLRTPAEGADTVVWLGASRAARGQTGRFWLDRQARSTHLLPWTRKRRQKRRALRTLCERLS